MNVTAHQEKKNEETKEGKGKAGEKKKCAYFVVFVYLVSLLLFTVIFNYAPPYQGIW